MPKKKLSPSIPDSVWLREFRRRLLAWYRQHQRDLPWRNSHDPYVIWVSEIMLQQTQVATVLPHFERFMARFPDLHALAAAEETDVLKFWEGLGYYRRARQMHMAARVIKEQHAGVFPSDFQSVLNLPGIGRYTAGAICSFAYDQKKPIVEANTQRLYARLLELREAPASSHGQKWLWSFAEAILPHKNVRSINQAVMELGALVCLPKPRCEACPIALLCRTKQASLQHLIPLPSKKISFEAKHDWVLLVRDAKGRYLVRRCEPGEWWTGLWDFPRFPAPVEPATSLRNHRDGEARSYEAFGQSFRITRQQFSLKHAVTKYRITLSCFDADVIVPTRRSLGGKDDQSETKSNLQWVSRQELDALPMSAVGRKIVKRLEP